MSLKKINSNSNYPALNRFANNHIKRQNPLFQFSQKHVFKQNKKAEQDQNPSHLKNLNIDCLKVTANCLTYSEQVNLVSTCEELRGKTPVLQPDFNIDTIKNAFEVKVTQFINFFKDDNGNFKHSNDIANEINNETINLHQDPLVLKEGVKTVFSNMSVDYDIRMLLLGIKNNLSQDNPDKLEVLASIAIEKMSDDHDITDLLEGIKDNLSPEKLEELASVAIEKMSNDYAIRLLLNELKYNIYEKNILEQWKTNK